MKKLIALLLLVPAFVMAQTFPVNNLTVNGNYLQTGGTFTATGLVGISNLASQAANTVVANVTGSPASPTAFAMPSCSTSVSALNWTTSTGFTCNTGLITAATVSSTYAPLVSPGLTGTPTAPTAAQTTNTTQLATTAFVQQEGLHYKYATGVPINGNTTITTSQFGQWFQFQTAGVTATLPAIASSPAGVSITFQGGATGGVVKGNAAENIIDSTGVSANTLTLSSGQTVTLTSNGPGAQWFANMEGFAPSTYGIGFGTSIIPNITPQIVTTATSTNTSSNITVTSATGIAVGMGVYASFVGSCSQGIGAFTQSYVTAIVGTTVTMSCPATATNGSPVTVSFGQNRYDTTSVIRANDAGFITAKIGDSSYNNTASWLDQVSTGQDFRLTSTLQVVPPAGGGYGITVGARTSSATGGAAAFPFQSIFYADTWGNTAYSAENMYLQDNLAAATAGHGPHIQMEQSINSLWGAPATEDPYTINATNQTILHRYDCGTGQLSSPFPNNCTTAMDIVSNGAKLENGLVIANGAIDTSGGVGNGISMPLNVQMLWYSAASTFSAAINSPSAGNLTVAVPAGGQVNFQIGGVTTMSATTNYITQKPTTLSTIPACTSGLEGAFASITDSTTAVFNAAVSGGGTNHVAIRCNGSGWVVF